jgi:hypothetical protein
VVGRYADIIQKFLDCDPNGRAATPDTHNKVRAKSALDNLLAEQKRVAEEIVRGDKVFFHQGLLVQI